MDESNKMSNARSLIGADVYNTEGNHLGGIEDIVIDVPEGMVMYAVLAAGGILGVGGRLYAVPWQAIHLQPDHRRFVLDVTPDRLNNAPSFARNAWPDMSSEEFSNQIHGYYGLVAAAPRMTNK